MIRQGIKYVDICIPQGGISPRLMNKKNLPFLYRLWQVLKTTGEIYYFTSPAESFWER